MENFLSQFSHILSQNIWLAFIAALIAGFASSFSPCILSAMPLIIGYVDGYAGDNRRKATFYSLFFCTGLILTFTALGASSALVGRFMLGAGKWWYIILGVIMAGVALEMFGVFNFSHHHNSCSCHNHRKDKGALGAFLLGILGGVLSSPCATPVLAAILAFVAGKGNIAFGILLLAVYAVGHTVLIFIAGISTGAVQKISSSTTTMKLGKGLKILFGILVLSLSMYLFYLGF